MASLRLTVLWACCFSSAAVISAREAVVELPPLGGDGVGYSVKWFEEDNPAIFDQQATASLQSRLVLSDLSPGTEYVAVVRRTATAAAAAAAGEAGDNAARELRFSTPEASRLYEHT
ncbi:unnamed protein product [Ectocarpus sp. 12 AP-2014]